MITEHDQRPTGQIITIGSGLSSAEPVAPWTVSSYQSYYVHASCLTKHERQIWITCI